MQQHCSSKVAAGVRLLIDRRRRLAIRYAEAGWPVLAGAWWDRTRYRCGGAECSVSGLHVAGHTDPRIDSAVPGPSASAASSATAADLLVSPHTFLLASGSPVDVLELPGRAIEAVDQAESLRAPVARLPTGGWLLFAASPDGGSDSWASIDPRQKGLLLHGEGSLVPLPPSLLQHGRVRWRRPRPEIDPDRLPSTPELLAGVLPLLPPPITASTHPSRTTGQGLSSAAAGRG